jgi:F-type H+-transporting ATPase subunit b
MPLLQDSLVSINPGLMIWTLVTFAIVLFVLKRYAFGPIQQLIDERRQAIAHSLEEAERARAEAQEMIAQHQSQLADSRREATKILEDARREAEERQRQAQAQLEADMERRTERARAEIEAETRQSLSRIKEQLADLTVLATEKVVRAKLDESEQRRLIEDALTDVDYSVFGVAGAEGGAPDPRTATP